MARALKPIDTAPTQERVDAGLVEEGYEPPLREDRDPEQQQEDEEQEAPTEVVLSAPSATQNPHVSEEEQGMELAPVVFGPPAYGSPDPATSQGTLMPLEQYPEGAISEDYGLVPDEEAAADEESGDGEVNATQGAVDLAEQENVDLSQVQGTGEGGRITKADVEAYLSEQGETA